MGRKHCWKRRNCSLRAISPFPTLFSKDLYCRNVKTRACLGKAYAGDSTQIKQFCGNSFANTMEKGERTHFPTMFLQLQIQIPEFETTSFRRLQTLWISISPKLFHLEQKKIVLTTFLIQMK